MPKPQQPCVKIVLLGHDFCGKTSLLKRFTTSLYPIHTHSTILAEFSMKTVKVRGLELQLHCWDTAGNDRFKERCVFFLQQADAIVICFELEYGESFEKAKYWANTVRETEDCPIYLCRTKSDESERIIEIEENIISLAEEFNAPYFTVSSKSGENVQELFMKIAEDFVDAKNLSSESSESEKYCVLL